ncbi:MAG: hypothetical protein HY744_22730 [Deltaproteobacteria bacterium]|nr:hypothetical protein [Deltaproteobacteria bacterium]
MGHHFSSFTPEAMRALGQEMAAGVRRRAEHFDRVRGDTFAMLAEFRRDHRAAESQRRRRAEHDAEDRRLFASELRSGAHALLGRFGLGRRERAADLQDMAGELRAASDAFRRRPRSQGS